MQQWKTTPKISYPENFYQQIGGNKLIAESLVRRGLSDIQHALGFLEPSLYSPRSSFELTGMEKAVELLLRAIRKKKNILVWGDFDVDGQTSTTILTSALQQVGSIVKHYIPVRAKESHGIHLETLKKLIKTNNIDLLLTCDTGITENDAVEYAKKNGLDVIITDHHQLPTDLPPADAIINPRLLPLEHPLASLPGVGVAYKLIEALLGQIQSEVQSDQFLDLVSLGIVADVAELVWDTRYLLQLGIQKLRSTRRVGLLALFDQAEIIQSQLDEELIAFGLAPRLNALGRLSDANLIVEFLTTYDQIRARTTAIELEALNARRKLLTDQVTQGALSLIDRDPDVLNQPILVLSHPEWPSGVIGIVASRLVEYFHKPVILITTPPNDIARGSARSINGVNITDLIKKQSHLLLGFGGHPMAAGLSINPQNIAAFQNNLSQSLMSSGELSDDLRQISIDAWVNLDELNLDFIQEINRLAPFGAGNKPLLFATKNLIVEKTRLVGRFKEHRLITVRDQSGNLANVLWWQSSIYPLPEGLFDLAFITRSVDYRGQTNIQIIWTDSRPGEETEQTLSTIKKSVPKTIDLRGEKDPKLRMTELLSNGKAVIWGEGQDFSHWNWKIENRKSLTSAQILVILTIPPGLNELQEAINIVNPQEIVFFAIDPMMDNPNLFLRRLLGLLKYSLRVKNGKINLEELASLTSQKISTIDTAIKWMASHEIIELSQQNEYDYILNSIKNLSKFNIKNIGPELQYLLKETAAFRKFYCRVDPNQLLVTEQK